MNTTYIEIPPSIQIHHQTQNIDFLDLPNDIINCILSNLDPLSFVRITSTCRQLNNEQENIKVLKEITQAPDHLKSVNSIHEYYTLLHQNNISKQKFEKQLEKQLNHRNIIRLSLVIRRCLQNIVLDIISELSLILFFIFFGTYLDGNTTNVFAIIFMFIFTLLQVIFPILTSLFSYFSSHTTEENIRYMNRDLKMYSGATYYIRQQYYWNKKRGCLHFLPIVLLSTIFLVFLYCLELVKAYTMLLPITIYTTMFTFCGCFSFNLLPWTFSFPRFEWWWLIRVTPYMFLLFISLLLFLLRAADVINGYYICYFIPLYILISCIPCSSLICCCISTTSLGPTVEKICFGYVDTGYEEAEDVALLCECWSCIHLISSPWIFYIMLTFFALKLDNFVDWSWGVTFIPIELLILLYATIVQFTFLLPSQLFDWSCECCYYIVDNHYIKIWKYPLLEKIFIFLCCVNCPAFPCNTFWNFFLD
ncbi:F-box domain-containing protein [Entamoeba marina]